ncbi:hypothetical protein LTS09_017938 [Friedmanniomyces endolithicus]|nr:hypothetical protein LTS09_017938 [Friedmanniomyces endolithicus]
MGDQDQIQAGEMKVEQEKVNHLAEQRRLESEQKEKKLTDELTDPKRRQAQHNYYLDGAAEHKTTSKAWRTKKTNDVHRDIETIEYRLPVLTEDFEDLSVKDSADDDYVATPSKKDEEKYQDDDDEEGSDGEESRYNAARSRGLMWAGTVTSRPPYFCDLFLHWRGVP